MSSEKINGHQFCLQTKLFQEQEVASALEKAQQLVTQSDIPIRVNIAARKICHEAFSTFKKSIEQEFASESYQDLIVLTLQSRETLFFVDLKERVLVIISNPT